MTEQEQRIAIAEAWGFIVPFREYDHRWDCDNCGYPTPELVDAEGKDIPNYPRDLNAMHEAEKTLDESQRTKFYWELAKIVLGDNVPLNCTFLLVHATAAQRAEAFLRTLGKWSSSPLRESE